MRAVKAAHLLLIVCALVLYFTAPCARAEQTSPGYSVDALEVTATLRPDGSALITENWTITFTMEDGASFSRRVTLGGNGELGDIAAIKDLSVSVDSLSCAPSADGQPREGAYVGELDSEQLFIEWYKCEQGETHEYSLRYIAEGAVKLYNDKAYFSYTLSNGGMIFSDVSIDVACEMGCYPDEITIEQSGALAGRKYNSGVELTVKNTSGEVGATVTFPPSAFDTDSLRVITRDMSQIYTALAVAGVALCVFAALLLRRIIIKDRLFREKWLKRCKKNPPSESVERLSARVFSRVSPAALIKTVSDGTVSEADYFIVTALELAYRGYIIPLGDGFGVSQSSDTDPYGRRLDRHELYVLEAFSDIDSLLGDALDVCRRVRAFNRRLHTLPHTYALTAGGRETIRRCFELRILSKRYEFVPCEEISDDFFSGSRYTPADLVISVINEYYLSLDASFKKPDVSAYNKNLFVLRDVYDAGARQFAALARKKRRK